jgi:hypothetical protein
MNNLVPIVDLFTIKGKIIAVSPLGSGHIHETYYIQTDADRTDDYVLQRINTHVFRNPQAVTQNIRLVTRHIQNKLQETKAADIDRSVLRPVGLKSGAFMHTDETGCWRCFHYIPDHVTYDRAVNDIQVYEGGKAYGTFLHFLSDLPADNILETIPGFHNLDLRLHQFEESIRTGMHDRIVETAREIEMLRIRRDGMRAILEQGKAGSIPLRIVHHDTKINNVLFSTENKALCVIDLDTVMPGFVHDDFGDSIRTFTNTGEEDDANLERVSMNIRYFEAFARGFLEMTGKMLNPVEIEFLALSARVMTYMQVLRFLTDYLNGDVYYRVHHPLHNLQRTRAQLKLLLSMEGQYDQMNAIIQGILA